MCARARCSNFITNITGPNNRSRNTEYLDIGNDGVSGLCKLTNCGAVASRMGLLVAASKGTLFLDEIGDISHALQIMLLRLIETRLFRRIGENENTKFTGRFVFATNSLDDGFRDDLYHRISTFRLKIKPLREREADAKLILKRILTDKEIEDLLTIAWRSTTFKGNVRELLRLAKQYKVLGRDSLDFR